ncbi:hypothetical protein DFH11DRAFT_1045319 [Phellopilus nigrolimitatus]|nr:hypothetical protein DFH11DRAFT_1045319 [Phellopilus nigrolimitatus]
MRAWTAKVPRGRPAPSRSSRFTPCIKCLARPRRARFARPSDPHDTTEARLPSPSPLPLPFPLPAIALSLYRPHRPYCIYPLSYVPRVPPTETLPPASTLSLFFFLAPTTDLHAFAHDTSTSTSIAPSHHHPAHPSVRPSAYPAIVAIVIAFTLLFFLFLSFFLFLPFLAYSHPTSVPTHPPASASPGRASHRIASHRIVTHL